MQEFTQANPSPNRPDDASNKLFAKCKRVYGHGIEYDQNHAHRIECIVCASKLTDRGVMVKWLSNSGMVSDIGLSCQNSVTMFTTDLSPTVGCAIDSNYVSAYCDCFLCDTFCLTCGIVVGYHVIVPCKRCLVRPNHGHFWMLRSTQIKAQPVIVTSTHSSL